METIKMLAVVSIAVTLIYMTSELREINMQLTSIKHCHTLEVN